MSDSPGAPIGGATPGLPAPETSGSSPTGTRPQHLCLVLPSTGEFDSRTYRIASACLARGHRVTVLARWQAGLPDEEFHPAGYRIVRLHVRSVDGLPFPGLRASLGRLLRRLRGRSAPSPSIRSAAAAADPTSGPGGSDPTADGTGPTGSPPADRPVRQASLPRRAISGLIRRLAIPLTIRAHARLAREVGPGADLYHGMAYMGIPVALSLGRRHRAPVVYDARDIYLEARNLARMKGPARWYLARIERSWARAAGRVVTVNDAYADVMADRFGTERPLVVMNCSFRFTPPEPPERRFHEALGLDPKMRVVLYHGGLFPERGIEQLIAAIREVPDAVLVLMGYGALEPELRRIAALPETSGRVAILAAVPPQELHGWVASADVAAMPIQASTLNHRLTTPNKLFEAMAAAVPVVASDLPGMATIVREVDFGRLCDPADPASIAAGIRAVLDAPREQREQWRANARRAAAVRYNWETQVELLLAEYGRLTGRAW